MNDLPKDILRLKNLNFHAFHGCLPEERQTGTIFTVTAELHFDQSIAGSTDDLADTVDAMAVYNLIQSIMEGEPVYLVETLGERISKALLSSFPVCTIRLIIHKHASALPGRSDGYEIEIIRHRDGEKSV